MITEALKVYTEILERSKALYKALNEDPKEYCGALIQLLTLDTNLQSIILKLMEALAQQRAEQMKAYSEPQGMAAPRIESDMTNMQLPNEI